MNGQWEGQFTTSSNGNGSILINIDERETFFYQGVAYTHPDDLKLPRTAAFFRTKDKNPVTELRTDAMLPLDLKHGISLSGKQFGTDTPA